MTSAADPVSVQGLTKSFGSREVLRGLDLSVPRGELVGLVGPNGAGKSTLLRILTGLSPAGGGKVRTLGLDPAAASLQIRNRATYLPGETSVYVNMTGQAFLDFALSFYPARIPGMVEKLARLFELPLRQRVRTYSAGMKQKLALMASLVPDVELYILDEPDRALDATVRFRLREVLADLRDQGRTLLLSSHHLSEVESLADRLEFLLEGRMVPTATIAAARDQLMRRTRVRLADGVDVPSGCKVVERLADGTLLLETPQAPLRTLPDEHVLIAEIGVARLEDLYKVLASKGVGGPAQQEASR
jgi:ABC-2 type transport system ATP-binding protein